VFCPLSFLNKSALLKLSLRAKRSNLMQGIVIRQGGSDCFVVALLAMTDNMLYISKAQQWFH
jgi:hypothetical protein